MQKYLKLLQNDKVCDVIAYTPYILTKINLEKSKLLQEETQDNTALVFEDVDDVLLKYTNAGYVEAIKEEYDNFTVLPLAKTKKITEMEEFFNKARLFNITFEGFTIYFVCDKDRARIDNVLYFSFTDLEIHYQNAINNNATNVEWIINQNKTQIKLKIAINNVATLINSMREYYVKTGSIKDIFKSCISSITNLDECVNFNYNYNPRDDASINDKQPPFTLFQDIVPSINILI